MGHTFVPARHKTIVRFIGRRATTTTPPYIQRQPISGSTREETKYEAKSNRITVKIHYLRACVTTPWVENPQHD